VLTKDNRQDFSKESNKGPVERNNQSETHTKVALHPVQIGIVLPFSDKVENEYGAIQSAFKEIRALNNPGVKQ